MTTRRYDTAAVIVLIMLWLLFFWRLFTPIATDQASLKQGDFSGQFVAFAAYQYARFSAGEVPLWNPYNNGGLPFIADTQAAAFYPPRLATIALSNLSGGWTYHTLELEMAFHILAFSLMMYALVRRTTITQNGTMTGSLVASLIASYGGFFSGYPPLQLAILEAGIWLPLAILGILEATREPHIRWRWLVVSGFALGLSWMAGHPQTSWFLTYLLVAYLAYRSYVQRYRWITAVTGIIILGLISLGLAAVQLLPGFEYLAHTARVDLTFDAKGNGFPFKDLLQYVFPTQLSLFSPLYIGIAGLGLVITAFWNNVQEKRFWLTTALVTLGLSFGANSVIFPALYNLLPGLRFFRGQERAAYLVASSLAIVAGLTVVYLINYPQDIRRSLQRVFVVIIALSIGGIALAHTGWLNQNTDQSLSIAVFSALVATLSLIILRYLTLHPARPYLQWLLVAFIVFDLFSINMNAESTYDPVSPVDQLSMTPPPLVARALEDTDRPVRVDGFRGLTDNYGSLYQLADMRGISPLFLDGPFQIIEPDKINPLAWELFAVRYVYTDWQELPVPSEIIDRGEDRYGPVNLHRLDDPRPFAHLVYNFAVVDSDAFARALLEDPAFDPRSTAILHADPGLQLEDDGTGNIEVVEFQPEAMRFSVETSANAVLTLAHPHYPGWYAQINGNSVPVLRAYGGLSAIAIPEGEHTVTLTYEPLIYRIGRLLSLFTWAAVSILGVYWFIKRR